ncbi:MAG: RNA polymerase sigma factor [Salibacteraceae bacterium]|mgnify:CR=1 FL=1
MPEPGKNILSDEELLPRLRDPEQRNYAFNLLVRQFQERVYWHIRRMVIDHEDANDVMQNTFVKAWRNLDKFRGDAALFTWLYRIATNESLTFLKKKRQRFFLPIVDVENELSQRIDNDPGFSGDEIERRLQQAILTLPEKQRLVFNMKYFDDLKYDEISTILGTSVGALKASYHHAVKKIEQNLKST